MKDDRDIKIDINGLIQFGSDDEKIKKDIKDIEDYIRNSLNDYVGNTVESQSLDDIIKAFATSLQSYYMNSYWIKIADRKYLDGLYDQMPLIVKHSDLICQCGKDKHGFANHSNWCPKHE